MRARRVSGTPSPPSPFDAYGVYSNIHPTSERITLPLWRSLHSLNLMLPKEDRKAMLLRLFNDDSPLMDHSKERFLQKTEPADTAPDPRDPSKVDNEDADMKDVPPTNDDTNLIHDEPISSSVDDDDEGGVNIGTAGLDSDATAAGAGKGVNAKEEFFGTSAGAGLDTSGQGGG